MLYKYSGNISSFSITKPRDVLVMDIIVYKPSDRLIAPTRLTAYGGLADYINQLEMTDDEERYLEWNFFYDENLSLAYIEIPAHNEGFRPAKVITGIMPKFTCRFDFRIFGESEHIMTDRPEPMSLEEYTAWNDYKRRNMC